jgi:hypothetical protein
MNLRKNAAAKLTALAAALFTLAGGFVLVHRNPPASDAAPQPVASTAGPSPPAPASQQAAPSSDAGDDSTSSAQQTAPPVTRMTHTRTHAS